MREIAELLPHVELLTLDQAGVEPTPEEDGIEAFDTFIANARAKADHFMRITGLPTIADDSGLGVDAIDGAPGVHSRRFSGRDLAGFELDRANNDHLLHLLRNVPHEQRTAHYTCAAVLHEPDGHRLAAIGTCSGIIADEPRGTGGFGYDPLFILPHDGRSFGEMSAAEKHRFSHRARAFRALATLIDHHAFSR